MTGHRYQFGYILSPPFSYRRAFCTKFHRNLHLRVAYPNLLLLKYSLTHNPRIFYKNASALCSDSGSHNQHGQSLLFRGFQQSDDFFQRLIKRILV